MRTNRVLLAAAAAVVAFALTGCGDGGGEAGRIPTAGDGATSGGTTAGQASGSGKDEVAAYVEGRRAYVKCLRENGIDAPDPDANGQVDLGDGVALKKNPTFRTASEKCAPLSPPVPEEIERRLAPKLTPEQIKTQFAFADCMQKNGAPDFPDPAPDGNVYGDVQWDSTTAAAKQAARTCAPIIGQPVDQGPGKG
ncbi:MULTISPECIES: hypothetical protein [Streptomyces]|uniref:Lipoprotein n=1 Tax=Streptomyces viridochromogenes TaxID=1938 RepID=A0A0L8J5L1_STRVR|nr:MULTISPECIES: hypothetical protein [Streptomyces]KOG08920.1 lipoprotein [Streptomyces viridochromogenes]